MVPPTIIVLDELPLTPSGKIDRNLLASPDFTSRVERNYVAPRNDREGKLAEIWEAVLKESPIGINDNFFEIGGHSLLAAQVITRIRETFEIELTIRDLFDHPTIPELSSRIDRFEEEQGVVIGANAPTEDEEEIAL